MSNNRDLNNYNHERCCANGNREHKGCIERGSGDGERGGAGERGSGDGERGGAGERGSGPGERGGAGERKRGHSNKSTVLMAVGLLVLAVISLFVGVSSVSVRNILGGDEQALMILLTARVPRLLSILLSGVGLSVAGVIMQQLSSNRFISPTTGSTVEWARLGILVAILFFPQASSISKMLIAFAFAFAGTAVFMQLLQQLKLRDAALVPLIGIIFGSVVGSITTFLAYQNDLIQSVSAWMQSSFTLILSGRYELLYLVIPLLVVAFAYARNFTIIAMGKDMSVNLGISYNATLYIGLLIVSVISASVIVTAGSVPFIGVIVPNMVRMYRGDNLERSLPDIALTGALFLLACDLLSRIIIYPFEIPVSVTAGVIGCILFMAILSSKKARGGSQ